MSEKPWPKSRDQLRDAGYGFRAETVCRSMNCRKSIELWRTPAGKTMPLIEIEPGLLQAHFVDCIDAKKFRKVQR